MNDGPLTFQCIKICLCVCAHLTMYMQDACLFIQVFTSLQEKSKESATRTQELLLQLQSLQLQNQELQTQNKALQLASMTQQAIR